MFDSPEKEMEHLQAKMGGILQENADTFLHHETASLPEEPHPRRKKRRKKLEPRPRSYLLH